jgi:hypothetical protein
VTPQGFVLRSTLSGLWKRLPDFGDGGTTDFLDGRFFGARSDRI